MASTNTLCKKLLNVKTAVALPAVIFIPMKME